MAPLLLAVKGQAQHGKDTVTNILIEEYGFARVAFADPVKQAYIALDPYVEVEFKLFLAQTGRHNLAELASEHATEFMRLSEMLRQLNGNMDLAKQHKDVRRGLQRMGTEVGRDTIGPLLGHGDHMWIDIAEYKVKPLEKAMISDLRFPNEGVYIKDWGGIVLDVFRPNFDNGVDPDHPSEKFVKDIPFDYQLLNDGTEDNFKQRLREQVRDVLEKLGGV